MGTRHQRPYGELVALHASLAALRPLLTWQPTDWLAATTELRGQLADLPGLLRALRAHPALHLAGQPALTGWPLDVDAAIEQLRGSPAPDRPAGAERLLAALRAEQQTTLADLQAKLAQVQHHTTSLASTRPPANGPDLA